MNPPDPESARMGRQHVFVVNGDPEFLNVLRELFQDEGYNVTTTNFVPGTFDQLAAAKPDVLVIDLVHGDQAGRDLIEQIKQEALTRQMPLVVVSTDPHMLKEAEREQDQYGEYRYIAKPFDLDGILAAVEQMIGTADRST